MKKYIGKCIYCLCLKGEEELTDEHVVPEGLLVPGQEALILEKASCKDCQETINKIETDVLRNLLKLARSALGLRSKHKTHQKVFDALVDDKITKLPIAKLGAWIMLPIFEEPHFGQKNIKGINIIGAVLIQNGKEKLLQPDGAKSIGVQFKFSPVNLARVLAKIAYGFAVFKYGMDRLEKSYLPDIILGTESSVGKWVGTIKKTHPKEKLYLRVKIGIVKGEQILCHISLFDEWDGPTYVICVSNIRK